jgi:X-X-X-Leu-X-X-Gly heptad repeat protein
MAATATVARLAPYLEQLLEDEAARGDLRRGADKLREAYERSQKRRVKATRDEKLRAQLRSAMQSLSDGANELISGAQKPKRRRGRLLLRALPLAALGAGVAIALNEDLRSSLFGSSDSGPAAPQGVDGSPS